MFHFKSEEDPNGITDAEVLEILQDRFDAMQITNPSTDGYEICVALEKAYDLICAKEGICRSLPSAPTTKPNAGASIAASTTHPIIPCAIGP